MRLTSRSFTLLLVVATWFTTVCMIMAPSHACCQQATNHLTAALPSCCTGQLSVQAPNPLPSHGLDSGAWVSTSGWNTLDFLANSANALQQSRLANTHVPDQSGRYLELRVLLN